MASSNNSYRRLILITIDCLRKDRLEIHGADNKIMPFLNKLCKKSFIFENAISNGASTPPAFYAMFTSKIPTVDGHYTPLNLNLKNVVKILQDNRINTCGIHSNPHLGRNCNYENGFNYFFDFFEKKPVHHLNWKVRIKKLMSQILKYLRIRKIFIRKLKQILFFNFHFKKRRKKVSQVHKINVSYTNAKIIIKEVIRWLETNFNSNFFLWIHFMDAHRPYNPPDEYISKFSDKKISLKEKVKIKKMVRIVRVKPEVVENIDKNEKKLTEILYNAELNYLDHFLGIFFNYLKKIDILNDLNFIITADHGESLFEHKKLGHQASLYDELLKIPLIIKLGNNSVQYNKNIDDQVQLIDLAPTILDLFNLPKENSFEGSSLIPLLYENNQYQHPEYAICATLHNSYRTLTIYEKHLFTFYLLIACRTNNWKLIFDEEINEFFLFNLKKDPLELDNLINNNTKELLYVKKMLFNKISPYIKEILSESTKIRRNIDKNLLKLLHKI